MTKLGASDVCHLHVANSELRLLCAKDGRLLVAWPFTCLRRYMSTRGKFTVEAGRRAPTGEGKFTFLTPQHDEIYKLLDNVVKSRAGHKPGATSSHEPLKKTKSVPSDGTSANKDVPHGNGYDHLIAASSPGTDHKVSPGSSNSMKNAYAAPYGHLPSRDAKKTGPPVMGTSLPQDVPGSRLSVECEEGEKYNTLNHPVQGSEEHLRQHPQKVVGDDDYCTLEQHPRPPTERKDTYDTLHHHGSSQPLTASHHQNQVTEDVYNVLGETLHPVVSSGIQPIEGDTYNTLDMKSASQSQIPMPAPPIEKTYNTLDHAAPARPPRKPIHPPGRTNPHGQVVLKPSPKPPTRKLSGDPVNKLQTFHSSSVHDGDDTYNTLETTARPPPPPVRKMPESKSVDGGDDETYNVLETSKARHPPPSPVTKTFEQSKKLQKSQSITGDVDNDMYNTLDAAKVGPSPLSVRKMKTFQTSSDEGDDVYNTLDATTRVGTSPSPASGLSNQSLKSVGGDEMYNKLEITRAEATSSPVSSNLSRNDGMDDMYNTLDKSRMVPSSSVPVHLQRSFLSHGSNAGSPLSSPVKKDSPTLLKRNSTSSLQSVRCPLDVSASQPEIPQKSSSLDDLDSYASIDYATMSPPKVPHKQLPVPVQRSLNPKNRKSSAPDIISIAKTNNGKDAKKGGKSGLVLNLKASLEAGGLDFTKPRRKPKKLSRDDSEELATYAEVEEHGVTPTKEDVFAPGTPPMKNGRSSSSPADPSQGDVYDELDQSAPRPKSLQITKARKSPKK